MEFIGINGKWPERICGGPFYSALRDITCVQEVTFTGNECLLLLSGIPFQMLRR